MALAGFVRPAWAYPIFARKYRTSCTTCHTVFPKLNPFGQAFRLNGYRMPKETEDLIKQEPVSLGSEAYRRLWPSAVMPSQLPGNAPVAINLKAESVSTSSYDPAAGKTTTHNDFQFPQEANLFSAGTLGEHMSFMTELTFGENPDGSVETEIEHARLDFDSIIGPEHLVNLRVGMFAPNLYDGFQEMWLMTDNGIDSMFTYNPVGYNGGTSSGWDDIGTPIVSLPARVRGIEVYGVAAHRFFYTFGFANKIGPGGYTGAYNSTTNPQTPTGNFGNNAHKDFYARVDYKFGGMGLDGDSEGVNLPPENWRETSLRVGLLGLTGNGQDMNYEINDPLGNTFNMQDVNYTRAGVFASLLWRDLNVFGVYLRGNDKLQLLDPASNVVLDENSRTFNAWFTQADYVINPTFIASVRYEHLRPADTSVEAEKFLNLNFTYLIYANVKTMLEYREDLNEHRNNQFAIVLRTAF
ncbi:MAG TPA: hypothetical protein VJ600_10840 [Holophagaceae bacterium]|nr:hypothetical protein [Holophagaceae bacterium]